MAKTIYRLAPCPAYDVEGMEQWLNDMAKEGLLLTSAGFLGPWGRFRRSKPCDMRHQLTAAQHPIRSQFTSKDYEMMLLYDQFGWSYVTHRGYFHIFRTTKPEDMEPDKDMEVQALSLDALRKYQRREVSCVLLWLLGYPLFLNLDTLVRSMLASWSPHYLAALLLFFYILVLNILQLVRYGRIQRKLRKTGTLRTGIHWRKSARKYRSALLRKSVFVLTLVSFCFAGMHYGNQLESDRIWNRTPLQADTEGIPFALMADFASGDVYELDPVSRFNRWSDPLAPDIWELWEHATVTLPDGRTLLGIYENYYYETSCPILARLLALEYTWEFSRLGDDEIAQFDFNAEDDSDDMKTMTKLDLAGIDYAVMPDACTVILQADNKVIVALMRMYDLDKGFSEGPVDPGWDWVPQVAESIREP